MHPKSKFTSLLIVILMIAIVIAIKIEYTHPYGETVQLVWDDKVNIDPCGVK